MSPPAPPSASGTGTPSRPSSAAWRSSGERESAVRVEFLGDRRDHALGKAAHRVAEQPVLVREVEIHSLHDTGPTTMRRVDDGSLARYADAIVRDGLLIGPGDVLAVHPEPIQRELAVALTEAGYRAGARYVDVLETDPRITRARALLAPEDTLDWRPAWEDARMRELVREGAGIVWIAGSEDPQVLADVPPAARRAPRHRPRGPAALPPRGRPRRRALRGRRLADARPGPRRSIPSSSPTPPSRRSATTCCASRGSVPTIRPTAGGGTPSTSPSAPRG